MRRATRRARAKRATCDDTGVTVRGITAAPPAAMRPTAALLVLTLTVPLAACVQPPPAAEPVTAPGVGSPLAPERPDDRIVLGWLDAVTAGIECPMAIPEARRFWTDYRNPSPAQYLVQRVACLCDVVVRGAAVTFSDACAYQPQPTRYQRDDGEPASPDEQCLLAWERHLIARIQAGDPPTALTRHVALAEQLAQLAATVAATGDPDSEHWQRLQVAMERVRSDAAGASACLLTQDLHAVKLELANHERVDLGGRPSTAGRALLAEAQALIAPRRAGIRGCERLEHDREYQQLQAKLERARERLAANRQARGATRDQADCNSDTDDSSGCGAAKQLYRIEKRIEQIEARYGVD